MKRPRKRKPKRPRAIRAVHEALAGRNAVTLMEVKAIADAAAGEPVFARLEDYARLLPVGWTLVMEGGRVQALRAGLRAA